MEKEGGTKKGRGGSKNSAKYVGGKKNAVEKYRREGGRVQREIGEKECMREGGNTFFCRVDKVARH